MSRIGKLPIPVPTGVDVFIEPDLVRVKGYSHPVQIKAPDGIDFEVPQPTQIVVRGIDKQAVGEVVAYVW